MPRIDKVLMAVRAIAGTTFAGGSVIGVVPVGTGGSVVPSGTAAGSAAWAVVCPGGTIAAGKPIACFKKAEIVEFAGTPSVDYFAGVAGAVGTASANSTKVGKTLEGDRLVVDL